MTHAFFKALLFMAAGSVIAAMAGEQNLDQMGGFRRAMPFTFGCMVIGGLALSGVPPFSGFFSKDEILAYVAARDDWHIVLAVLGFAGSPGGEDAGVPALPRAPQAPSLRGHAGSRSASAARSARRPARPTASASSPPRTRPRTA